MRLSARAPVVSVLCATLATVALVGLNAHQRNRSPAATSSHPGAESTLEIPLITAAEAEAALIQQSSGGATTPANSPSPPTNPVALATDPPAPARPKTAAPAQPPRVAVLMYHDVYRPARGAYSVTPERLESDLNWFLENGWQPLSLAAFQDWMRGKRELMRDSFLLTFDDGYDSFRTHALPVLKQLHVPAVLFVISGSMGRDPVTQVEFLTSAQIAIAARSGLVSIGSHTHALHQRPPGSALPAVFSLGPGALAADLHQSLQSLQTITGRRPVALAWPHGSAPDWAVAVARDRFALVFTGESGFVDRGRPDAIRRFPMEWRQTVHLERSFGRR